MGDDNFIAYQIIIGYVNSKFYGHHLGNLIKKLRERFEFDEFVLILDNASIHKTKHVMDYLNLCRYIYLPPYTPQLNPIEKLWKSMKDHIS